MRSFAIVFCIFALACFIAAPAVMAQDQDQPAEQPQESDEAEQPQESDEAEQPQESDEAEQPQEEETGDDLLDPEVKTELEGLEDEVADLEARAVAKRREEANEAARGLIEALKVKKAALEAELANPGDGDTSQADEALLSEVADLETQVADLETQASAKRREEANAAAQARIEALRARKAALEAELAPPAAEQPDEAEQPSEEQPAEQPEEAEQPSEDQSAPPVFNVPGEDTTPTGPAK